MLMFSESLFSNLQLTTYMLKNTKFHRLWILNDVSLSCFFLCWCFLCQVSDHFNARVCLHICKCPPPPQTLFYESTIAVFWAVCHLGRLWFFWPVLGWKWVQPNFLPALVKCWNTAGLVCHANRFHLSGQHMRASTIICQFWWHEHQLSPQATYASGGHNNRNTCLVWYDAITYTKTNNLLNNKQMKLYFRKKFLVQLYRLHLMLYSPFINYFLHLNMWSKNHTQVSTTAEVIFPLHSTGSILLTFFGFPYSKSTWFVLRKGPKTLSRY